MYFLVAFPDVRRVVSSRNHEGIWILLALLSQDYNLSALSRAFFLHSAGMHLKSIRNENEEAPFLRRRAPRGEQSFGRKQFGTPSGGGQKEGIIRETQGCFPGRCRQVSHGKVQGMARLFVPRLRQ